MNQIIDLLAEFHAIDGFILRSVQYLAVEGCIDKIFLNFDRATLVVQTEPDDDTIKFYKIEIEELRSYDGFSSHDSPLWDSFIGKSFGWGWITINQQNFLDGILLSFDGIIPNILFTVVASSINVSRLNQLSE
jgi:Family of unknown function (DUF6334)